MPAWVRALREVSTRGSSGDNDEKNDDRDMRGRNTDTRTGTDKPATHSSDMGYTPMVVGRCRCRYRPRNPSPDRAARSPVRVEGLARRVLPRRPQARPVSPFAGRGSWPAWRSPRVGCLCPLWQQSARANVPSEWATDFGRFLYPGALWDKAGVRIGKGVVVCPIHHHATHLIKSPSQNGRDGSPRDRTPGRGWLHIRP